jgi:hypothetical protein
VQDLTFDQLPDLLDNATLNLLRRGADGSLRLSADRWGLAAVEPQAVVFRSVPPPDEPEQVLEVLKSDVDRLTWDRLPKQQVRAQVRFHLTSGDLLTFSGTLGEPG